MPLVSFDTLPAEGRLWVFPASRPLDVHESARLRAEVDAFLASWAAHGVPLRAGARWEADRFLLVGVDVAAAPPSGCSIDALVRRVSDLGDSLGVTLNDHDPVRYRDEDGAVCSTSRADFRALAASGRVGPDLEVFDTTITRVGALTDQGLARPARSSWHGKVFFRDHPAG